MGRVVSESELIRLRGEWKRAGKVVVCASGSFDLLHPGHIRLLEQARSLGDILVVLVSSEASMGAPQVFPADPKGKSSQSITPAAERVEIIAALAAVDYVTEFEEVSLRGLLMRFAPGVVVRGGVPSSSGAASREDEKLEAAGSKLVRIPLEPGYSRALLLERIQRLPA